MGDSFLIDYGARRGTGGDAHCVREGKRAHGMEDIYG